MFIQDLPWDLLFIHEIFIACNVFCYGTFQWTICEFSWPIPIFNAAFTVGIIVVVVCKEFGWDKDLCNLLIGCWLSPSSVPFSFFVRTWLMSFLSPWDEFDISLPCSAVLSPHRSVFVCWLWVQEQFTRMQQ